MSIQRDEGEREEGWGLKMSDEVLQKKRERDEANGTNSRVSKTIRGERKEGVKRSGNAIPEILVNKLVKTGGEARGDLTREVITRRDVRDPQGAMVDTIDHVEWEDAKEEIRELKMLV